MQLAQYLLFNSIIVFIIAILATVVKISFGKLKNIKQTELNCWLEWEKVRCYVC